LLFGRGFDLRGNHVLRPLLAAGNRQTGDCRCEDGSTKLVHRETSVDPTVYPEAAVDDSRSGLRRQFVSGISPKALPPHEQGGQAGCRTKTLSASPMPPCEATRPQCKSHWGPPFPP